MRYLKGTLNFKFYFGGYNITLHGYYDADWVGNANDRRSTMGYVFFVRVGAISWNCKRQPIIARSIMEAEYMAASHGVIEVIWLRQLLEDIGDVQMEATPIKCDNQGCLAFAKNPKHHSRTKHIDIQHHFIKKKIEMGVIDVKYYATKDMLANLLTKALKFSSLILLPNELGNLISLTTSDISESSNLVLLQNEFSNITSLNNLYTKRCSSLTSLPNELDNLSSLTTLKINKCSSLIILPNEIYNFTSLTTFDIGE
uniref:Retrovirus-related Pol polyprotein from transposon TNT 1-94 n=1 Tax=Physcomitrium patens TaxID=3218 RepID=A0A2K1L1C8_PHYPA|nr:hypothetical protein PHYPA_002618 [Physcomitrium patens]